MAYTPPVQRFGYDTATRRWPTILTQVVDALYRRCHEIEAQGLSEAVQEGQGLIEQISGLKYELTHDRALAPLHVTDATPRLSSQWPVPSTAAYDDIIAAAKPTWHQYEWLFTECYLYRRLRLLFETSTHWKSYDPFGDTKARAFRASAAGVHACATWWAELQTAASRVTAAQPGASRLFSEVVCTSLWGNATDLSLLTQADYEHLQSLQSTPQDDRLMKLDHVLVNDMPTLWNRLRTLKRGRIDLVLDNSGFELVTDLLLADFLLSLRTPIPVAPKTRAAELRSRIEGVRTRIQTACDRAQVAVPPRLLAVSKLHPPSDVMAAYEATGQRHFGENYVQELVDKANALPEDIQWHFIGGLQSNKAKLLAAVPNLYAVESLDSEKLALGLQKAIAKPENASLRTQPLYVYVQVNTSQEEGKSGLAAMTQPWKQDEERPPLMALAQKIMLSCPHLRLRGLMTIGALANSRAAHDDTQNPDFASLVESRRHLVDALKRDAEFQNKLRATTWWTPQGSQPDAYGELSERCLELSMGMSADLEAAIAMGSSNVRIGSDCFGSRSSNSDAAQVREAELKEYEGVPLVDTVVFHTKNMPWFDTTKPDIAETLAQLTSSDFFSETDAAPSLEPIRKMGAQWKKHFDDGRFRVVGASDAPLGASEGPLTDFWTQPWSFGALPDAAPELLRELQKSDLVIFKGDLNYRKLTQDAQWPSTTPFAEALGPLAGKFPLVSLRTCKADVVVGLDEGQAASLDERDPAWRVNGAWAVIQFAGPDEGAA